MSETESKMHLAGRLIGEAMRDILTGKSKAAAPTTPPVPLTPKALAERLQAVIAGELATLRPGEVRPAVLAEAMFTAAIQVTTLCKAPGGAEEWAALALLSACGGEELAKLRVQRMAARIRREQAAERAGKPESAARPPPVLRVIRGEGDGQKGKGKR